MKKNTTNKFKVKPNARKPCRKIRQERAANTTNLLDIEYAAA